MSDTPQNPAAEAPRRRTRKPAVTARDLEVLRAENARLAAEAEDAARAIESLRVESGRHAEGRAAAEARIRQLQGELDRVQDEAAAARAEATREVPRAEKGTEPHARTQSEGRTESEAVVRRAVSQLSGGELAGAIGELRLRVRALQQLAGSALVPSTERVTATARQAERQLDRLEQALADVRGNA